MYIMLNYWLYFVLSNVMTFLLIRISYFQIEFSKNCYHSRTTLFLKEINPPCHSHFYFNLFSMTALVYLNRNTSDLALFKETVEFRNLCLHYLYTLFNSCMIGETSHLLNLILTTLIHPITL